MKTKKRHFLRRTLAFLAVILLLTGVGYWLLMRALYPLQYETEIRRYAERDGISPSLVCAVVCTESHFQPDAVSYADAKGLMQLTDDTYAWVRWKMGKEAPAADNITDPDTNLQCGIRLLKELIARYAVTETALAAYNAGIGNVDRWLTDPQYSADGKTLSDIPFSETKQYVTKVIKTQKIYQTLYHLS